MSRLKTAAFQDDSVTNAKLNTMPATTLKGNNTAFPSDPLDLTVAQVKTMLNLTGTNSGDVTLGTFGSTPADEGASLSAQVLTLQPADATHGGGVSTTTQTFAGNKTFTGTISASGLSGSNTGDVTLGAIGATPTANGASLSGQVLTLQPANGSFGGVVTTGTQTFAGNKTFTGSVATTSLQASGPSSVTGSTDAVQFFVKGFSTQTTDVFQIIKSDNTGLLTINNSGQVTIPGFLSTGLAGGTTGTLKLVGSTSGTLTILAPAAVTSYSVTMPSAQGAASTVLTNNGSGVLSWAASGGGTTPTVQRFTSGSGTYTTPANVRYLVVTMCGGGGGGGGGTLQANLASANSGSAGGQSYFRVGASPDILVANGGSGGVKNGDGVTGGTVTVSSPAIEIVSLTGGSSGVGQQSGSTTSLYTVGGKGGCNPFGSDSAGGGNGFHGLAAVPNTGAGGGGGGAGPGGSGDPSLAAGGGGAGGYIKAYIPSPSATYSYAVGALGGKGTGATGGTDGADGASGVIIVEEFY